MNADQWGQLASQGITAILAVATVVLSILGYRRVNGWEKRPAKRPAKRRKRKRPGTPKNPRPVDPAK